jgi:hypothetical protein
MQEIFPQKGNNFANKKMSKNEEAINNLFNSLEDKKTKEINLKHKNNKKEEKNKMKRELFYLK